MCRVSCSGALVSAIGIMASAACAPPPDVVMEPPSATAFGQQRVRITAADGWLARAIDDGLHIEIGGIAALDLVRADDGRGVMLTVQGSPESGPADVVARTRGFEPHTAERRIQLRVVGRPLERVAKRQRGELVAVGAGMREAERDLTLHVRPIKAGEQLPSGH